MHLHLETIGGMSGDMFIAAILDCWPESGEGLNDLLCSIGLAESVSIEASPYKGHSLSGTRFAVQEIKKSHHHRSYQDIQRLIESSSLDTSTKARTLDIFHHLAVAEGIVHGCSTDEVTFHEVGSWDSITDITIAAHLIDRLGISSCSVSPIPLGSGRVQSQHGLIPVPAPATLKLLEGFKVFNDGIEGERITPTGAAILKHLAPCDEASSTPKKLLRSGIGFGTKKFPDFANILRVSSFEITEQDRTPSDITMITFEVDDQTSEDLAIGLDIIRETDGVIDVTSSAMIGKKGRHTNHIQILCEPECETTAINACFEQTTTLGVRLQRATRHVLTRKQKEIEGIGVKTVQRPHQKTAKAEIDDIAKTHSTHASRTIASQKAVKAALDE